MKVPFKFDRIEDHNVIQCDLLIGDSSEHDEEVVHDVHGVAVSGPWVFAFGFDGLPVEIGALLEVDLPHVVEVEPK